MADTPYWSEDWTRVRDKESGHVYSTRLVESHHEVLKDEPAADGNGNPLPAEPNPNPGKSTSTSGASKGSAK